ALPGTACSALLPYTTLFGSAATQGTPPEPEGTSCRAHALALAEQGSSGARRAELEYWRGATDPDIRPLGLPALDPARDTVGTARSEEHTSELQSRENRVCRL